MLPNPCNCKYIVILLWTEKVEPGLELVTENRCRAFLLKDQIIHQIKYLNTSFNFTVNNKQHSPLKG